MPTYTDRLKLATPDIGACNWDKQLDRNRLILDAVDAQSMLLNGVVSGGNLSGVSALNIDIDETVVNIDEFEFVIPAQVITVQASSSQFLLYTWIYVDENGALTVSTIPPAGKFAMIGGIDSDLTQIAVVGDLRNSFIDSGSAVLNGNLFINPEYKVNQRDYITGTGLVSGDYGHDMCKSINDGNWTVAADGTVTMSAGSMGHLNDDIISHNGEELTCSVQSGSMTLSGGGVVSSVIVTPSTPKTFVADGTMLIKGLPGESWSKPKLETGNRQTAYHAPQLTEEEQKCLRYFWKIGVNNQSAVSRPLVTYYHSTGGTSYHFTIQTPVVMRVGTVADQSGLYALGASGQSSGNAVSVSSQEGHLMLLLLIGDTDLSEGTGTIMLNGFNVNNHLTFESGY